MHRSSYSILLVEDDKPVRDRFVDLIRLWTSGHLVKDVGTLKDAQDAIQAHKIDLLITDLRLPDGMGTDAIKLLKQTQPEAEVMVISVLGDHRTVIKAIEAGATGFLLKDASPFNLIEAIEELLDGGSPVSPSIARTIIQSVNKSGNGSAMPTVSADEGRPQLTARELEILQGVVKGLTNAELAEAYGIASGTVPVHIRNIYRKLQTRNRSEAIYEARRHGLVNTL